MDSVSQIEQGRLLALELLAQALVGYLASQQGDSVRFLQDAESVLLHATEREMCPELTREHAKATLHRLFSRLQSASAARSGS